ncbi:MAG: hypothetical protein Q7S22_02190 [Candidatus Micrarchaeota archaeon]|nr:hypothetical protein [Candidatus Micrarchaeota archaeon]
MILSTDECNEEVVKTYKFNEFVVHFSKFGKIGDCDQQVTRS